MRILQVCPFFHPVVGGMERVVLELSKQMLQRGHDVTVFTSDLAGSAAITGRVSERRSRVEGVEVFRFKTLARLGHFAALWPGFLPMLKGNSYDAIHVHAYRHPHSELALIGARRIGVPLILQPHWPGHSKVFHQEILIAAYDRLRARGFFNSVDITLALTPFEESWLRGIGARHVAVLPNGIPAHILEIPRKQMSGLRRSPGEFLLASVGRIDRVKGFSFVLEAIANTRGTRYAIAGPPGDGSTELCQAIRRLGLVDRVSLLGELDPHQVLALLDEADAYIQPSLFESSSLATLEAMARGKPCAGSKVGGLAWLLEGCGLSFTPGDVEAIATCLSQLRDDASLRASLSQKARLKASELTWDRVGNLYEDILERVAAGRPH